MGRKKLTDEEKNKRTQEKIDSFAPIDKDEQLSVFTKKTESSLSQEIIDMYEQKPVSDPSKLSGKFLSGFNGKNYLESLNGAVQFIQSNNENVNSQDVYKWVDYYPQEFEKRSILISYNVTRK